MRGELAQLLCGFLAQIITTYHNSVSQRVTECKWTQEVLEMGRKEMYEDEVLYEEEVMDEVVTV